jgi:hypothetical protein
MKTKFLFLLVALICFCSVAFSAAGGENFNKEKVIVEYHGSWQWGSEQYKAYTLTELKEMIKGSFSLDIDDDGERWIGFNYQVGPASTSWKVEFLPALGGSGSVQIKITRDGKVCFLNSVNGLHWIKNTPLPPNSCGISFDMDWEAIGETDVIMSNFSIDQGVKNTLFANAIKFDVKGKMNSLIGKIKKINEKFRVIDIHTDDFYNAGDKWFFYATPFGLNEESQDGIKNSMIVSDNGKIKYLIFLPNVTFANKFKVLKPTEEININSIKSFDEIISMADKGKFVEVSGRKIETASDWANIFGTSVVGAGSSAAVATGVAFVGTYTAGTAAVAATATTAATAATGATFAVGGLSVGTGGMILIPIAIAAVIALPTWYLTDTDTYTFDNSLTLNYDAEFFSGNEWKINHLMYSVEDFTAKALPEISGTFVGIPVEDDVLVISVGSANNWVEYIKSYSGRDNLTGDELIKSLELFSVSDNGKRTRVLFDSAKVEGSNLSLNFSKDSLVSGKYALKVLIPNKNNMAKVFNIAVKRE